MKDTGTHKELKTIKRAVAGFRTDLRQKIKNTDDKSLCNHYKKVIKKLEEHGKKLFSDPMTVYVDGDKRTIFILRTNNILEQHFRRKTRSRLSDDICHSNLSCLTRIRRKQRTKNMSQKNLLID